MSMPPFLTQPGYVFRPETLTSSSTSQKEIGYTIMKSLKLGSTGLDVSRVFLGCMTYGDPKVGTHVWAMDEDASRPFIRQAVEAGINVFDTANAYSGAQARRSLVGF
jgi:hypothetical protein